MVTNNKINIKCNLYTRPVAPLTRPVAPWTRPVAPSRGSNHRNICTDTALIVDRVDSSDSESEKKKKKKKVLPRLELGS